MFLGFYPETGDQQKIAWVGMILLETALVWHLQQFRELKGNDTWVNYMAVIQMKYYNEREVADAQLKLGQLLELLLAARRAGVARPWKRHHSNGDNSNTAESNGIATAVARGSWQRRLGILP